MSRAMLNRAAMRVADTTEVSGGVTAKSVKRGFCAKKQSDLLRICALAIFGSVVSGRGWLVLVTASMGLYLLLPDRGLAQNNQGKIGINGTYSVHITGYVITDSSGDKVPLAVAGQVTHFTNKTSGTESDVVIQRCALDCPVHRHLGAQFRWGQLVGDRHPEHPGRSNAAFYPVPYAGRQYHQ